MNSTDTTSYAGFYILKITFDDFSQKDKEEK